MSAQQAADTPLDPAVEDEGTIFKMTLAHDTWEAWVWTALGLAAIALILWIVALLRLGTPSVYAWGVGIPLTSFLAVPIALWGLMKSVFRPPAFRKSRIIGFVAVVSTAFFANTPLISAPVSTANWTSSTAFRLPFDGAWYTITGGDDREHNYLATSPPMRWGYVFTRLTDEDGKPSRHSGDGKALTDYPCYGSPILAPADGSIVELFSDAPDNKPGEPLPQPFLGNHLVLQTAPDAFLYLGYLKQDSLTVKLGEQVKRGQKLAECGNSGTASYPQVHVHLQHSKEFPIAEGLPLRFDCYAVSNGKNTRDGMPIGSGDPLNLDAGLTVTPATNCD
jgi:hypothetical protein